MAAGHLVGWLVLSGVASCGDRFVLHWFVNSWHTGLLFLLNIIVTIHWLSLHPYFIYYTWSLGSKGYWHYWHSQWHLSVSLSMCPSSGCLCVCPPLPLRYIHTCAGQIRAENWLQHKSLHALSHPQLQSRSKTRSWTHWGWDKIDAINQTTFSDASSWMKIYKLRLRFH